MSSCNTTITVVLSDSTHRTTSWTCKVPHATIVRTVRERSHIADQKPNRYVVTVIVSVGACVTVYNGSDIDELIAGSERKAQFVTILPGIIGEDA